MVMGFDSSEMLVVSIIQAFQRCQTLLTKVWHIFDRIHATFLTAALCVAQSSFNWNGLRDFHIILLYCQIHNSEGMKKQQRLKPIQNRNSLRMRWRCTLVHLQQQFEVFSTMNEWHRNRFVLEQFAEIVPFGQAFLRAKHEWRTMPASLQCSWSPLLCGKSALLLKNVHGQRALSTSSFSSYQLDKLCRYWP